LKNPPAISKPKSFDGARVLLIDEVDVFFSKEFYGKVYVPQAQIKSPEITKLLDLIW
jgi:hypothetical protein